MALEVPPEESNRCVRGCCRSAAIPLHLPAASFSLLSPIARGSESTVYEARLGGERAAAKKPVLSTSDDLDKFHYQLQLLWFLISWLIWGLQCTCSKLDHPGLAKLIAAHARPPNYLMFFEFFEPPNLADKIHVEEWSPSIQQVVNIASYLAKTLEYLQILGIVHRDIKPANILLDKDLLPRLADFGLAMYQKDIKSVSVENWKSSGKPTGGFYKKNMVGTLIYMAPEILRKDLHTEKSDVYSFAISVNELLTGVVPYTDLRAEAQAHTVLEMTYTEQQLTSAVVSQGLRPALALPESGSPPSLLSLIQRCWDPDPKQRPSFEDIIQELNAIQKHLVTYSCPPSSCSVNMSQTGNAEVHHYQETLNWFNQGELFAKKANKLEHTVNPWSDSFDQSSVSMYRPTLSWGSFATCGRRETMEDTHFMLPCMSEEKDVHSFGIFDGHRGAAAAEFSVRAVPGFLKQFGHTSPTDTLVEAFMKSDTAFREELIIHQKSKRIIQKDWHPGCTAVTALIVRNKLFVANAGDCRAILSRAGKPFPMTRDHVASCAKERERVIKEGTEVRWQIDTWRVGAAALQVTRSIGDDDLKPAVTALPEVIETDLSTDDEFLVMASDGLWDVVGNEDVLSIIRDTVKEPGMCSKRLATEAASRGSKDNITVIVVFLRPVTTAERVY
ncbi:protein kinase and PP2C-like domain-containing protein isoform X2 [Lolium perenne]|uniref:protein kinase and PP2C-like domain-containing protein isoform X2 n=1 Tax=Lolium perenne TaxID=4522 RepID=UPI0021F54890|nr:protein kinase and PP2C-like domain-containing protein isoform X4 [Lolium perenne]